MSGAISEKKVGTHNMFKPSSNFVDRSKAMLLLWILFVIYLSRLSYEGGSICNENPFITPSTNALGSYAICQTKDQSVAVKMVHETLFYLSKFNKFHTF